MIIVVFSRPTPNKTSLQKGYTNEKKFLQAWARVEGKEKQSFSDLKKYTPYSYED